MRRRRIIPVVAMGLAAVLGTLAARVGEAQPPSQVPHELEGVEIIEHLNERLPLDLTFVDHDGKTVTLGDYFNAGKPVIITLNYYRCPLLCTLQLNGMVKALKEVDFEPGSDFRIITLSIDPNEDAELAAVKRRSYLASYGRESAAEGWAFLTGTQENIHALAEAIGFKYRWNERRQEWAHAAAFFVATPDGRLSRYLYGTAYEPSTVRMALIEGGQGKIGSTLDRFLLWCFHYDNLTGQYTPHVMRIMRLGGLLTLAVMATGLFILWRRGAPRWPADRAKHPTVRPEPGDSKT